MAHIFTERCVFIKPILKVRIFFGIVRSWATKCNANLSKGQKGKRAKKGIKGYLGGAHVFTEG